jgi:7-cyano-7-deazaguanine synthase
VPLERTVSCYDPGTDGHPCCACDACQLRDLGFREADSAPASGAGA